MKITGSSSLDLPIITCGLLVTFRKYLVLWSRNKHIVVTFHSWDDDDLAVAFDAVTGDTHLMTLASIQVYELIQDVPTSHSALCCKLVDFCAEQDPDKIAEFVALTLVQLQGIKFILDTPI